MKQARWAVMVAVILSLTLAVVLLPGCGGGNETHTIDTTWQGDLRGMETEPPDNDTGVGTDTWIHVFWPYSQYQPPATFHVRVEEQDSTGQWNGIVTTLSQADSDPQGGSWWFVPDNALSPGTWYRIEVMAPGVVHAAITYFKTEGVKTSSFGSIAMNSKPKSYKPANASAGTKPSGESSIEHVIVR